MNEKRKKIWIIFSGVIAAVLVVSLVFGMFTNLKTVSVEFRQRLPQNLSRLEENILEKVEKDGEFEYGKGLLFANLKVSTEKIEKKNPFVKVEQVIRDFPNSAKVYISEREPASFVKKGGFYYVLDKDFKVLDKFAADQNGESYLAENYLEFAYFSDYNLETGYESGDFVTTSEKMALCKNIHSGIIGSQENVYAVKSVEFSENGVSIIMKKDNLSFDDGITIKLEGTDDLTLKTFVALEFYKTIDKTMTAQTITLTKNATTGKYSAKITPN